MTTVQEKAPIIMERLGRQLYSPEAFDQLAEVLSAKELQALKESHQWIKTFLTQVITKNPKKIEAICPFVGASLESQQMLFSVAQPADPNNIDDIHQELRLYSQIFCELEPTTYPQCLHKCVVPIFPDTPGHLITDAVVHNAAREEILAMGIMIGDASPDRDFQATWDPSFNPMQSPVPLYALRTFIPTDWRFINNTPHLRAIYKARFGEPKLGDEYETLSGKMKELLGRVTRKAKKLVGVLPNH